MWKRILLRTVTALLLLGFASSVLYVGAYCFTTWRTERLSEQLRRQRSDAMNVLPADPSPANDPIADAPAESGDATVGAAPSEGQSVSVSMSVGAAPSGDAGIAVPSAPSDKMSGDTNTSGEISVNTAPSGDSGPAVPSAPSDKMSGDTNTSGDIAVNTAPSDDAGIAVTAAPANNTSVEASPTASGDAIAGASAVASEHAADPTPAASVNPEDDPLLIYYGSLAQENPDMIGWIRIEDTPVDYPVMYSPDEPQYYLNRDFGRNYTFEGIPFLDARCDANAPSDNLIVYGHNMRSGRMFGTLSKYRDAEYRLEHPLVSFDTLEERRVYRVYAGFVVQVSGDPEDSDMICYRADLTSDEEQLQALLDFVSSHALFVAPELAPELHDQLLTLSTCTSIRKSERFIVMAIRVE